MVVPRERQGRSSCHSVGMGICLSVVFQAMQSLRKAISSSSCDLPATVKEAFDVTECCHAIDCLN